jgi:hypothetical protein
VKALAIKWFLTLVKTVVCGTFNEDLAKTKTTTYSYEHRVGRLLSFFPVVGMGDSPNPPVLGGGALSLAREGLGESQFRRGDIHCGTLSLYIYVLKGNFKRIWMLCENYWN